MNYQINMNSQQPAYIQLYHFLVRDIADEIYTYGSKLPSKRTIAEDTGVSVITVEHALALLCDEGYVEAKARSGYFVIYRRGDFQSVLAGDEAHAVFPDKARKINVDAYKGNNAHTSNPIDSHTEFSYTVLAKTMRRVLLDYSDRILARSPSRGCPELRREICRYLARSRGITVDPEQIIIGSGAEYLYGLIAQLLGKERIFAIENPSYSKIRKVYEAMGITCDPMELTGEGIPASELNRTRATVLHVTPFNSYPSGITVGISKKYEYLQWAKVRGGVLIEDNYDSELTVSRKPEEPLFSMAEDVDVFYINTFSRTIAPSMRIGYMILPEGWLEAFHGKLGFYSCTVPVFDQYVIAELLKSGDFERHINRVRRMRRKKTVQQETGSDEAEENRAAGNEAGCGGTQEYK